MVTKKQNPHCAVLRNTYLVNVGGQGRFCHLVSVSHFKKTKLNEQKQIQNEIKRKQNEVKRKQNDRFIC